MEIKCLVNCEKCKEPYCPIRDDQETVPRETNNGNETFPFGKRALGMKLVTDWDWTEVYKTISLATKENYYPTIEEMNFEYTELINYLQRNDPSEQVLKEAGTKLAGYDWELAIKYANELLHNAVIFNMMEV